MQRQAVESSNIAAIGYDPQSFMLEVEFHGGAIYQYIQVPEKFYDGLMRAPSKGKFFNQLIKDNYRYRKVT